MSFDSLGEFMSMGRHGVYVWSAYGLCMVVLIINVAGPLLAWRRHLRQEARRLRREARP